MYAQNQSRAWKQLVSGFLMDDYDTTRRRVTTEMENHMIFTRVEKHYSVSRVCGSSVTSGWVRQRFINVGIVWNP